MLHNKMEKISHNIAGSILAVCVPLFYFMGCAMQNNARETYLLPGKKVPPAITFKNLSPPYEDYDYLRGADQYPFQYEATSFSLVNAWWLAEISTLVHADESFVRSQLAKKGLPEIAFYDKQSTQCYVIGNDEFAIIAFRGSEIWKKSKHSRIKKAWADFKADFDVRLVEWPRGGRVHRGFKAALDEVWPELLVHITDLQRMGRKIWITGHSLGGALALLCGGRIDSAQGVYAYGAPRVGDEDFRQSLNGNIYRIVNNEDIVSRSPSLFVYVHVGELKFIDSEGVVRETLLDEEPSVDEFGMVMYGSQNNGSSPGRFSWGFIPWPIRDHVPLLYAIHLWNNLVDSREPVEDQGGKE